MPAFVRMRQHDLRLMLSNQRCDGFGHFGDVVNDSLVFEPELSRLFFGNTDELQRGEQFPSSSGRVIFRRTEPGLPRVAHLRRRTVSHVNNRHILAQPPQSHASTDHFVIWMRHDHQHAGRFAFAAKPIQQLC
jgi:hypothetical protein